MNSGSNILNIVIILIILRPFIEKALKRAVRGNIAVLTLEGVIQYTSDKEKPFGQLMKSLDKIAKRMRLPKALILRVNTPGGTVGASQALYQKLRELSEKGVAVVAMMEDVAASGGVYVAMAADKVVAHGGTLTGSIGVIMRGVDYSKVLEFIRIKTNTIKSGAFKDIMSPSREMTKEDRALLEGMVINTYEQFAATVAERRKLELAAVHSFADGRVFTGQQALAYGLIDVVGSFDDAVKVACELARIPEGKEHLEVIEPAPKTFASRFGLSSFLGRAESLLPSADLSNMPLWLMPGK